jgi:excisionase family DNA binding protein
MTAKITVERLSAREVRVTLVADIQISGNLTPLTHYEATPKAARPAAPDLTPGPDRSAPDRWLVTVEQTAEILNVGREKIYYLLRTGQLRSIKIGKLRRISLAWIAEFVEHLEAGSS